MTQEKLYNDYEVKSIYFENDFDPKVVDEIISTVSIKVAVNVGAGCIGHEKAYRVLDKCAEAIREKAPHINLYDNVFRSYYFYI